MSQQSVRRLSSQDYKTCELRDVIIGIKLLVSLAGEPVRFPGQVRSGHDKRFGSSPAFGPARCVFVLSDRHFPANTSAGGNSTWPMPEPFFVVIEQFGLLQRSARKPKKAQMATTMATTITVVYSITRGSYYDRYKVRFGFRCLIASINSQTLLDEMKGKQFACNVRSSGFGLSLLR